MKWLKKNYYLVVILLVLFIITVLIINFDNKKEQEVITNEKKYSLVTDYSKFFTVDSAINKYISYLENGDTNNIIKLLNKDYVNCNKINNDNLYDFIFKLDGLYVFSSNEMYVEKVNNSVDKYYVRGKINQEEIDSLNENSDAYYVVTMYYDKMLFDIAPYNGTIFVEES